MAIASPIDLDTQKLRDEIRAIYARVATDPSADFHFHRGPRYACDFLKYESKVDELPAESTASFAGVANPHRMGPSVKAEFLAISAAALAWTCCWDLRL
jgi:arsenite methyltransferase